LIGERLDQVVIGPRVEASHALLGAAERREQEDGHRAGGAQALAHRDAVEARQHDVEDNEVERPLLSSAEGLVAVPGDLDVVRLRGQDTIQRRGEARVVLHDQDSRAVHRVDL